MTAVAVVSLFVGCGQLPRIDVSPVVENERIVFDVQHSGINGILGFRVEDDAGELLWDVRTSYEKGRKITYGVLPPGGNRSARQEFPPQGQPPPDIRGKTVTVCVEYQYDSPAPSSGTVRKTIRIPQASE